jgi:23S rRNA pseudouridine1911/1915/1917 synthase
VSRHAFAVQGDGMRLDQAIPAGVTTISRRRARDLIERGSVSVDGVRTRTCGRIVKAGAAVVVEDGELPAVHGDVDELYRDDDIIVVDKPAGLATEPTRQASLSVADTLRKRGLVTAAVNRLDVDTSGVLVLARGPDGAAVWGQVFADGSVERLYIGLVRGLIDDDEGVIDACLVPPDRSGRSAVVPATDRFGKRAITHWQVIGRGDGATLVALRPQTGRTHQLRVHLAYIGHPLVGDHRYGPPTTAPHLGLHARALRAEVRGRPHYFLAPMPPVVVAMCAAAGLAQAVAEAPTR